MNIMMKINREALMESLKRIEIGAKGVTISLTGKKKDSGVICSLTCATNIASASTRMVCIARTYVIEDGKAVASDETPKACGFSLNVKMLNDLLALTKSEVVGFDYKEESQSVDIVTRGTDGTSSSLNLPVLDNVSEINLSDPNRGVVPMAAVKVNVGKLKEILGYLKVVAARMTNKMYGLLKIEGGIAFCAATETTVTVAELKCLDKVVEGVDMSKLDFTGVDASLFNDCIMPMPNNETVGIMFYGKDGIVQNIRIESAKPSTHVMSVMVSGIGANVYRLIEKAEALVNTQMSFTSSDMIDAIKMVLLSTKNPDKAAVDLKIASDTIKVSDVLESGSHGIVIKAVNTFPEDLAGVTITINPREFSSLIALNEKSAIAFNGKEPQLLMPKCSEGIKVLESLITRRDEAIAGASGTKTATKKEAKSDTESETETEPAEEEEEVMA